MTTITSTTNPKVKWIRKLQSQRSARQKEGHFVIEGTRLLREALNARAEVPLVLYSETTDGVSHSLIESFSALGSEILPASSEVIQLCSDTETPQGLLAAVKLPQHTLRPQSEPLLIVDRLRDPGNLGTLMRSAFAARMTVMLLLPGTVDPLNPKVVRSAMGAHFHLPFKAIEINELGAYLQGKILWVAEANRGSRYDNVDWTQPSAILVGGEAYGPSRDVLEFDHSYVHIPIDPAAESLNAAIAGSILMFEVTRQRGFE
jgi:TrmH family RNA methyltransferase